MVPLSENQLQASFCSTQVVLLAEGQTERQLTSKSGLFHVGVGVGGLDVSSHLIAAYELSAYQTWNSFPKTDNLVSRNRLP